MVPPPQVLYDAADLPATEEMFYADGDLFKFNAKIVKVMNYVKVGGEVLLKSVFF